MPLRSSSLPAFRASFRLEFTRLSKNRLFLVLVLVESVTFLLLVSLFGLTGSRAPTVLIDLDKSPASSRFARQLEAAHNSFKLEDRSLQAAQTQIQHGEISAIITIPPNFGQRIQAGKISYVGVYIDNVDTDVTEDIRRALPSAISSFAIENGYTNIPVRTEEHDFIDHDTGFIPYLVVSGLILDAFVIAGLVAAIAFAKEWGQGTLRLWLMSPARLRTLAIGKLAATLLVSVLAVIVTAGIVVYGFGIKPLYPLEAIGVLLLSTVVFGVFGGLLGMLVKRPLPIASLLFGLSLPLYLISGSLEPERFDGNILWALGHCSPVYPAVGLLEHAFHGFVVTPESITADMLMLCGWGLAAFAGLLWLLRKSAKARR